ncbi:lytic murein transglycosylase [Nocardioides mesophilus]|uniref:lytic murein transglycosylase n=1 Tax=Nocardioides mesophilus TaxID=433659 RepID=UPI00248383FC|nr:lytic murein transglycosylase [Nocardioides mesophilus]
MSHRLTTWQKATALVPLALLSGAWTTSLAGFGTASAATEEPGTLPDGTTLPAAAVQAPASLSAPGEIAPGVPSGAADAVVRSASPNGIPSAALAAYQRAAQVIDSADRSCHIGWQLIAAIGRVESDHGRYGGNTLSDEGVSTPGIYGIPLDGSHGTQKIGDSDGGRFDDDAVFDRAVGPMQFIPSTWRVVGVDGDGDGVRDPQDIDDAALATAVYLCSGEEDLATPAGQRSAVYRYNHSQEYVDLVLAIMEAYTDGDYSAVPNQAAAPTSFFPSYGSPALQPVIRGKNQAAPGPRSGAGAGAQGGASGAGAGTGGTGSSGGTGGTGGTTAPATPPATGGGDAPDPVKETVKKVTEPVAPVVEPVISTAQAVDLCVAELNQQYGAAPQKAVDACVAALQGKTLAEAQGAVGGVVAGLADLVKSLLGGVLGGLG